MLSIFQAFVAIRGGEGGIRTPGALARTPHFECGAIDHSATSPLRTFAGRTRLSGAVGAPRNMACAGAQAFSVFHPRDQFAAPRSWTILRFDPGNCPPNRDPGR